MSEQLDPDKPLEIDVEVGVDWQRGEGNQRLLSWGAGPCTVLAIHNGPGKIGYMGHLPDLIPYLTVIDEMIAKAASEGDITTIQVRARGDSPIGYRGVTQEEAIAHRAIGRGLVINHLINAGVLKENIDAQWANQPDLAVDAELNCETGEFNSVAYSIHDLGMGPGDKDI